MIGKIVNRITDEASLLLSFIKNYKKVKNLAKLSVLADDNSRNYSTKICPICMSSEMEMFARFPINIPRGQNHSLLYFDYEKNDIDLLKTKKEIMDKSMGFFVSITWNFCSNCKNGSLSTQFKSDHLIRYYSDFYKRGKNLTSLRRNTKELHGRYLSSLLTPRSNVLEIGAADGITAEYLARQGHKIYVYEPSKQFSELLKKSTLIVYVDDYKSFAGTMDAIYLHHVLEHIPDPINYGSGLQPLLKKNGILFIQVPDLSLQCGIIEKAVKRSICALFNKPYFYFKKFNCLKTLRGNASHWFDALANDHINAFTYEGLKYVVPEAGFYCETLIQSTEDRITYDTTKYAWPVDEETGSPPNGLTLIARNI